MLECTGCGARDEAEVLMCSHRHCSLRAFPHLAHTPALYSDTSNTQPGVPKSDDSPLHPLLYSKHYPLSATSAFQLAYIVPSSSYSTVVKRHCEHSASSATTTPCFAQAAAHGHRIPSSDPAHNAASFARCCSAMHRLRCKNRGRSIPTT